MLNIAGATASVDYYEADFDCWYVLGGSQAFMMGRQSHILRGTIHTSALMSPLHGNSGFSPLDDLNPQALKPQL